MSGNPMSVGWPPVSTPRSIDVPAGVRRFTLKTARGRFAAFEAMPATGVCERRPALLVPGFTGSKEDFLPILGQLAAAGRRVVAIDLRGQYQTPGTADGAAYRLGELGADVGAVAAEMAGGRGQPPGPGEPAVHLLGHSFGGLVARETVLAKSATISSLTLMSSGPGPLTGPAAGVLRAVVTPLRGLAGPQLRTEVKRVWNLQLAPQAEADGTPPHIIEFLRRRMLGNHPVGLVAMAEQLLDTPDRTAALASSAPAPILVLYGEYDDKWETPVQEEMAERLRAQRVCIPGATHSPAVEAPETTASTLNKFWNAAENVSR
jgi:pimeloyl-ACP methyl ester carboxylesterase